MQISDVEARPRWRGWLALTGAAPAWGLVRYLVCGLAAGIAFSAALPHFRATLLSALTGAIVAAASSGGPSGIARRLTFVAAGWIMLLTVVGFATGGHPVWAALAMAAVAFLTSVAGASGPLGAALGFLLSLSYLLVTAMARRASARAREPPLGRSPHRGGLPRRPRRRVRGHRLAAAK